MRIRLRSLYIALTALIMTRVTAMDQPIVLACNFEVISKNAETGNIISSALKSAWHIMSCFYKSRIITPWRLRETVTHMQKRGVEIASTTPGITNTIKKLFTELEEQGYGKFTDTAINCFNEIGVNPVVDHQAVSLLSEIKSFKIPTIGMGSQDSLEHEIYAQKILKEQTIDVHELYDGIITIPTLEEQTVFDLSSGDCFVRSKANPRWLVSRTSSPSLAATNTLKMLALDIAGETPIWSVNTKEQLAIVVNALHRVFELRPSSPDQAKAFDQIIAQSPIMISPTRV